MSLETGLASCAAALLAIFLHHRYQLKKDKEQRDKAAEIDGMMEAAAAKVAARIDAEPEEVLVCMRTDWALAGPAQRRHIIAYLKKETAVTAAG